MSWRVSLLIVPTLGVNATGIAVSLQPARAPALVHTLADAEREWKRGSGLSLADDHRFLTVAARKTPVRAATVRERSSVYNYGVRCEVMWYRSSAIWILMLAVAISGCDLNAYVPSAEKLRNPKNPSAAFLVNERDIRGIYGNSDVDAVIYAYDSSVAGEGEFWSTLAQATSRANWQLREERSDYRRYVRIKPRTGQQRFHSVEEARVAFNPESQEVFVAWVQSDLETLPSDFPSVDDSSEGSFAQRVVWPRFEKAVAGEAEGK